MRKEVQEERGQACPTVLTGKVLTRTKNWALVWQERPLEWRREGRPDRSEFENRKRELSGKTEYRNLCEGFAKKGSREMEQWLERGCEVKRG